MTMSNFRGTMPALITPFDSDGMVDEAKFRIFLDWLVPQVSGLYVAGSYGSGPIMTVS
ncbi:MAG: dihydrodipicolinate synthase family protein [Alphaproteobacteria bacterium]|nr:dihydrodipicolinate synthase family protein [Alphaproteobacteria bacterium]